MALVDRCIFQAASAGPGSFVVASAAAGFQSPLAAGVVDGQSYSYVAQSANLLQWEYGRITSSASATTFARSQVLGNALGTTAPINFSTAPQVLLTALAEDFLTPLGANLSLFVATTGSDSNPGTVGAPFLTIQHAVDVAATFDYRYLYLPTINVAAGTYTIAKPINLPPLRNLPFTNGFGSVVGASPATTIIFDSTGSGGFVCQGAANYWNLQSLQVDSPAFFVNVHFNATIALNFNAGTCTFADRTAGFPNIIFAFDRGTISVFNGLTITTTSWSSIILGGTNSLISMDGALVLPAGSYGTPGTNFILSTRNNLDCEISWTPTVTNAASFVGTQISFAGNGSTNLITSDGTLTNIPGVATGNQIDGTCRIGALFANEQFFFEPVAGQPATANIPNSQSWTMQKDTTNGPRQLVCNDAGTIHVRQIGRNVNKQTGTAYTMALFDQDGRVEMSNAAANTFTVPQDSVFSPAAPPTGTEVRVTQTGAGATTIAAGAGATVQAAAVVGGQWKSALLYKTAANTWVQTAV